MTPGLAFNADLHQYSLAGEILPSVTQILEACRVVDYSDLPKATRVMALARGSAVHSATQFNDEGDLDEILLDDALKPYLAAWRKFRAETGFTPSLIEHRVCHPTYRYAGTLDRIGRSNAGPLQIVDIKTSTVPKWTALQLAAYVSCLDEPRIYQRIGVALQADGGYRCTTFKAADYRRDEGIFLACLTTMRARTEYA